MKNLDKLKQIFLYSLYVLCGALKKKKMSSHLMLMFLDKQQHTSVLVEPHVSPAKIDIQNSTLSSNQRTLTVFKYNKG